MDKVVEALLESFPASDPPAYVAGKDRPIIPLAERKIIQAAEGSAAMADYRRGEQHSRNNLSKLRTERLKREMAVNEPVVIARKGVVREKVLTQKPAIRIASSRL